MGRRADSRVCVASDSRIRIAPNRLSSRQLSRQPPSAPGSARLRLDSPLPRAGAPGESANRARGSARRRQITRRSDGPPRLSRSRQKSGPDGQNNSPPLRADDGRSQIRPRRLRHRRQGRQGRRNRPRKSPLQIPRPQRLPDSRPGRPRRHHPRPRREDKLPPRIRPRRRPHRIMTAVAQVPESELLDALERHRDFHFRRIPSRRVTGEKSALKSIDEVGFCTGFTAGLGVPCLREAIAGTREPVMPEHIQHDYAIGMTWRIKDSLHERRLVYYGKVIARRPSFIAREMLGAFLRLRIEPGGYRKLYLRGGLSDCGKLVWDALTKGGAAETRVLKLSRGHAQPSRPAVFDRAMAELQEKFLALKVDERADPFSYVWDTMEHRWPDAIAQARKLTRKEAAYVIVAKYFETAAFGSERAISRLLGIDPALVEGAARRLEREGAIARGVRIDGHPGAICLLSAFTP